MLYEAIFKLIYRKANSLDKLNELLNNEKLTQEEIKILQIQKINNLIQHAYSNCNYYADLFDKKGIKPKISSFKDFQNLPILTKTNLKENLSGLKARNYSDRDLLKMGTGGSTGIPTHFYQDKRFLEYVHAHKVRNLLWTGWQPGEWDFRLWGSAFDVKKSKKIKSQLLYLLLRWKVYPAFEISESLILKFVEDIKKYKPSVIQGYTMPLVIVAKYLSEHKISFGYIPRAVINCAETLYDPAREVIERGFRTKVFNRYGGRELGDISHECNFGNMHINQDLVYVEIVDDQGNLVDDGQMGHILLTGLENYGMPFIRYKVEDMGVFKRGEESCRCGLNSKIIDRVLGRSQDIIKLSRGKYLAGEFFPHLFKDFDVEKFQVIQEEIDLITIKFVKGPNISDADIRYLKNKIDKYVQEAKVVFEFVEDIPTSPSGKFRFTISNIK